MSSRESTDVKDKDNKDRELELEQIKLKQMELELELKKMEQDAAPPLSSNECSVGKPVKSDSNHTISTGIIFCLTFLPPIGIIMVWRLKEPMILKIAATLYSLFIFSMWMGWISFGLPAWFLFTGQ